MSTCQKCGANCEPETEGYAIRVFDCGSRIYADGTVVSQDKRCRIRELSAQLAASTSALAERDAEIVRLKAALDNIIRHTEIAIGAKGSQMSRTACIARRALEPLAPPQAKEGE